MAQGAKMNRITERRLRFQPGVWVRVEGRRFCISQVLDLETVLVQDPEMGEARHAKVQDLQPEESSSQTPAVTDTADLAEITDHDWQRARERLAIIQPLLDDPDCTRAKVQARAESVGRHPATLYRWLQYYRRSGRLSTLVPAQRGVRLGQQRLDPEVERLLAATITEVYLSDQKRSVPYTYNEV